MSIPCNLLDESQEPTDEQLSRLMDDVAKTVRQRSSEADQRLSETIDKEIIEAQKQWAKKHLD